MATWLVETCSYSLRNKITYTPKLYIWLTHSKLENIKQILDTIKGLSGLDAIISITITSRI